MDTLDDLLSEVHPSILRKQKKLLKLLREAYTIGVPPLIAKSMTDRLGEAGGHPFHLGTPDPEMRRIASWLFTSAGEERGLLVRIIPPLWERHGREDVKLVGLLLANLGVSDFNEDPWGVFLGLVNRRRNLSIEASLEVIEELVRARKGPDDDLLMKSSEGSKLVHQAAVLILSTRRDGEGIPVQFVLDAPEGGELFERIRQRVLRA